MTTQFDSIYHSTLAQPGQLRIASSGLGWKSDNEKLPVKTVAGTDIKWLEWIRVARHYQLRIGTTKGRLTFDGFHREDFDRLQNHCKQYYNLPITQRESSLRGWNWGHTEVQGSDLAFLVAGKPAFEVPFARVLNTSMNKGAEVALEFGAKGHEDDMVAAEESALVADADDDPVKRKKKLRMMADEPVELRFYVPGSAAGMKKKAKKAKQVDGTTVKGESEEEEDEDDEDDDDEDEEGETAAQRLYEDVKDKAEIGAVVGQMIGTIPDVLCLTPRGRFDIDLYPDFFRLRGKTYDYRINYQQVIKLFLLPKPDDIHGQFVVNIDPPIRQGQTRYPYLVMQFLKEEMMELSLNLTDDDLAAGSRYEGLRKKFDDPAYEVVSIAFRVLTQKKVTTPGKYQSADGQSAVKCNVKANEGQLYLLEKQMLFISKQPVLVLFSEIAAVTFARVGGALPTARTFDLSIRLKASAGEAPVVFSSLNKEELGPIEEFLRSKGIRVKNEMEELQQAEMAMLNAAGSDDDDDAAMSVDSDGDKGKIGGDMDDDSESEDGDFQADSESDIAEEFDSDAEGSSSGSEAGSDSRPKKKSKK